MTPKREKIIKIRVSEDELRQLRIKSSGIQLAKWIRESSLAANCSGLKTSHGDQKLLYQLAALGNNLNQIARAVNSARWKTVDRLTVVVELSKIEKSLLELLKED